MGWKNRKKQKQDPLKEASFGHKPQERNRNGIKWRAQPSHRGGCSHSYRHRYSYRTLRCRMQLAPGCVQMFSPIAGSFVGSISIATWTWPGGGTNWNWNRVWGKSESRLRRKWELANGAKVWLSGCPLLEQVDLVTNLIPQILDIAFFRK